MLREAVGGSGPVEDIEEAKRRSLMSDYDQWRAQFPGVQSMDVEALSLALRQEEAEAQEDGREAGNSGVVKGRRGKLPLVLVDVRNDDEVKVRR